FCFCRCQCCGQRRHHLGIIPDNTEVRILKNWGLGIFVDRHHDTGTTDPYEVFEGATDADSEVELRRNRPAGESHLMLSGEPAQVSDVTRGRERRAAQGRGQLLDDRQVLRSTDAFAHANSDLSRVEGCGLDYIRAALAEDIHTYRRVIVRTH